MINLTKIEIEGFIIPKQKIELSFTESNIICIFGDNGSGKTTFLEILHAIFKQNEKILEKYNVSNIRIEYIIRNLEVEKQNQDEDEIVKYVEETLLIRKFQDEKYELIFDNNDEEYIKNKNIHNNENNQYDWSEFESHFPNISSLLLGINRGIEQRELNISKANLWRFFHNNKIIESKIEKDTITYKEFTSKEIDTLTENLYDYLISKDKSNSYYDIDKFSADKNIYFPYLEIDMIEKLLIDKYRQTIGIMKEKITKSLFKVLSFDVNTNIKEFDIEKLILNQDLILEVSKNIDSFPRKINDSIELLKTDKNYIDEIKKDKLIYLMLHNIEKSISDEIEIFEKIKLLVEEFNEFLINNKTLHIKINEIYIQSGENRHSLNRLSSGEKHMLSFLATILLLGEERDFILIDEPEISLNVDWQEEILSILGKLAPDSQIIVATHSPSVCGDYFDESIEILSQSIKNE